MSLDRARSLLSQALELPATAIGDDAAIGALEAWDSLAHLRLVQAVESEIGRALEPDAIYAIGSLADLAKLLADQA